MTVTVDAPDRTRLPALRALWQEAFGDSDEELDAFFETAYSPDRCRCLTVDGQVAAALYWLDCLHAGEPIAYLYAVATAKAFRGQGLCHRLMENTHRRLAALGYAGTILVPGDEGLFRFYARMGYTTCAAVASLHATAAATGIPLRTIDQEEYAARRRALLPPHSVIQEGVSLDLLQRQATLYAGEHFLLAATVEENTLRGIELLGDLTAAPAILRTLGCPRGTFRTCGKETPFAMYRPSESSTLPPPAYFGLAFD